MSDATRRRPTALLSFDVEEHSQIEAAHQALAPTQWDRWSGRIETNLDWLLQTLEAHDATATFFVLGYVARRRPWIVRWIADAGHELACHGYAHDRLHRLSPRKLAIDLAAARAVIEDQARRPLRGYRAPSFSLTRDTAWAVDVIADAGFTYDSSVQPIAHPAYGVAAAPRWPYRLVGSSGRVLAEVPPLTWQCLGRRLPVAGGGYFRLLPLGMTLAGVRAADNLDQPAAMYFHPWEFDAHQPRLPLRSARQRFRTYVGVGRTRDRLTTLLSRVSGRSYGEWLDEADVATWSTYRLPPRARATRIDPSAAAFDVLVARGEPALRGAAADHAHPPLAAAA